MDWTDVIKFLGGSTLVLYAVSYVAKSLTTHFLNRDLKQLEEEIRAKNNRELQELKGSQDRELQTLREAQDRKMEELHSSHQLALQNIQLQANERMEFIKSAHERIDRLERDLLKSREDAYGEIWRLTGALNLFGPTHPLDCAGLSRDLTNWYFSKGQLLTSESKPRYFLVQELLNFLRVRGIALRRPSDELLFSSEKRTIDALRAYRAAQLGVARRGDEASYKFDELAACVSYFKSKCNQSPRDVSSEDAWLLLQFVMSAFRSCVTEELGSRDVLRSSPVAEANRAGGTL